MSEIKIEPNKITIPLITEEEIQTIDNNLYSIIERFIELNIKDKDLALSQYIISKQQEVINKIIKYINEDMYSAIYIDEIKSILLDILKEVENIKK